MLADNSTGAGVPGACERTCRLTRQLMTCDNCNKQATLQCCETLKLCSCAVCSLPVGALELTESTSVCRKPCVSTCAL